MAITGISGRSALQLQSLANLRSQLDDLQRQLGSGQKADNYAGLGLDRGLAIGLRTQLANVTSYDGTIATVGTRLSIAQTALTQIDKSAHDVKTAAATSSFSIGQGGQTIDQESAYGAFEQIVDALNTQMGDQYVFSGKSTDQKPVASASYILDGDATHAGLKQLIAERQQADLGASGLGRLQVSLSPSGTTVNVAEDTGPFGFKLAGISSTLTGAAVAPISGAPATTAIDLSTATIAAGDTLKFSFTLPDGTTQDLTLTATTTNPPAANQFLIGGTAGATAGNLQTALSTALGTLASTTLAPASAIATAKNFFSADSGHPPQRVAGPPFNTATSLTAGTAANTAIWYAGEAGTDPARATAMVRIDSSITVSYGMRANEQAMQTALANIAVFATATFSASDPNASNAYTALKQRVSNNLDPGQGAQKVTDIEAEIAAAQTSMTSAQTLHQQRAGVLQDLLQTIEGASSEQVGAQILDLQTRLQASLQTTALLAHTSLVDYLGAKG